MARGDRRAAPPTPLVRVLTRRTGVNRRTPDPLLEVSEVFRVDVIARAFEGEEPLQRVIFRITQLEDPEMEIDYPLELPEEVHRGPHPALQWAYRVYQAVYAGDMLEALAVEQAYHHAEVSSCRRVFAQFKDALDVGQWRDLTASDFCTWFHLNGLNGGLEFLYEDEEIELMQDHLNLLFSKYPQYSISVLPIMTDLPKLTNFMVEVFRREHFLN